MARRVDIRRWILPDPQLSDPAWYLTPGSDGYDPERIQVGLTRRLTPLSDDTELEGLEHRAGAVPHTQL